MMNNYQFIAKIWKEGKWFVAQDLLSGVTTQGRTVAQAKKNLKEAVELYLEEMPVTSLKEQTSWLNTMFLPMQVNYGKTAL